MISWVKMFLWFVINYFFYSEYLCFSIALSIEASGWRITMGESNRWWVVKSIWWKKESQCLYVAVLSGTDLVQEVCSTDWVKERVNAGMLQWCPVRIWCKECAVWISVSGIANACMFVWCLVWIGWKKCPVCIRRKRERGNVCLLRWCPVPIRCKRASQCFRTAVVSGAD